MFSCSSFPTCSLVPCFSIPPLTLMASGIALMVPSPLHPLSPLHRTPAVPQSRRCSASPRLALDCGDVPQGWGHVVLQGMAVMKPHRFASWSHMGFCSRQKIDSIYSPALPASFTLIVPKGGVAQKQDLNLEALGGIRKQCDFCILVLL